VASYGQAGRNGGCTSNASTLKGKPLATRGVGVNVILLMLSFGAVGKQTATFKVDWYFQPKICPFLGKMLSWFL
jgi:hypothetical protein